MTISSFMALRELSNITQPSILTSGAVVVHWMAEWPEQQPFHLGPDSAKESFYALHSPTLGPSQLTIHRIWEELFKAIYRSQVSKDISRHSKDSNKASVYSFEKLFPYSVDS